MGDDTGEKADREDKSEEILATDINQMDADETSEF
jgi:hypothetical protein